MATASGSRNFRSTSFVAEGGPLQKILNTADNGSEFSDSASIECNGGIEAYYAHPYSSFERGTNENRNGIVRRFIPKGSDVDDFSEQDLQRIGHYINTLPRKRFGYKTPLALWDEQIDAIVSA